ncbi:MAG: tetratricopeptide repeat protein, partial [Beijerinckiaceae bacterium]
MEEALASYGRALAIDPNSATMLFNRGALLMSLYRCEEALVDCERALAIEPDYPHAFSEAANAALRICDWPRSGRYAAALKKHVIDETSVINPLVFITYCDEPALQLRCSQSYLKDKIPELPSPIHAGGRRRPGKARIAYLSADFHGHATSYLIAELFERQDRKRFELFGISFGADDGGEMRRRLAEAFDHFHDVRGRDDLEVAKLLNELEIDIIVDLKGYTQNSRFGIFAHRPAPIQVSYLGFPGTTGADFIDYVIADEIVLPFDQQPFWSEKIVHLPGCYQVNDRKRQIAERTPTRKECGLPEQGFVFCSFNNNYKITPPFFDIWMRLLDKVEGSVLWLLRDNAAAEQNLRREAAARGIDPVRLVFADRLPLAEHLARHRLADLFLDTLPVNAHTTASDALWAGLPVLTSIGKGFAARVAASLLDAVGLPELATKSLEEYETLALKLAREPALLSAYRERLEKNRLTAPLFDTDRFRQHIEQAYLTMLDIHDRGEKPRSFSVAPMTRQRTESRPPRNTPIDRGEATSTVGDFEEAFRHHKAGDLQEAVPRYQEILKQHPTHRDALYCLALARLQQNETSEGQALLEKLLTIDPHHVEALYRRGNLLRGLKQFEQALASYHRALAIMPNDVLTLNAHGEVLLELKQFEEALVSCDRILALDPNDTTALNNRAVALINLGRSGEALICYNRALAIEPSSTTFLLNRGSLLSALYL